MSELNKNPETVIEEPLPQPQAEVTGIENKNTPSGKTKTGAKLPDVSINQQETAVENMARNFSQNFKKAQPAIPDEAMLGLRAAMEQLGVNMEKMMASGDFERMQKYRAKTSNVYEVPSRISDDTKKQKMRFYPKMNDDGTTELKCIPFNHNLNLDNPFFGHSFTDEQKKSLQRMGHAGEAIPLTFKGSEEPVLCLVSYDAELNQLASTRQASVRISDDFLGYKFNDEQKAILRNGGSVDCKGLTSKNGNTFDATLMYDVNSRGLMPCSKSLKIINGIGDVKFTPEQMSAYHKGELVTVKDITGINGDKFTTHVRKNSETGKAEFLKPFMGQMLTPNQIKEINDGKAIFVEGLKTKPDKDGKVKSFDSYVIRDPESKRLMTAQGTVMGVKLTNEQVVEFNLGKPLMLENMKDSKGQTFTAYVQKNPKPTQGTPYLYGEGKCIPQEEWREQVKANNEGKGKDKNVQKAINKGATVKKDVVDKPKAKKTSKLKV